MKILISEKYPHTIITQRYRFCCFKTCIISVYFDEHSNHTHMQKHWVWRRKLRTPRVRYCCLTQTALSCNCQWKSMSVACWIRKTYKYHDCSRKVFEHTLLHTVNLTYNEQVYNEILLVTKSNESPDRSPITLHWVLYVCNEFVYYELSSLTKPSRGPVVIVSSIFSPVLTKCCTDVPN